MFNKQQMGGLEMALRAAGLAPVLDAANQLAAGGTIDKIMRLVDDMEGMKNDLEAIKQRLGIGGDLIEGTARIVEPNGSGGDQHSASPGPADRSADVA